MYKLDENSTSFTSEQLRVFNIFKNSKAFNLGVSATANWGNYSKMADQSFSVMGKFPENLEVVLPTGTYKRLDATGMVWTKSDLLKDLYGKEVKFSIKEGTQSKDYKMYVPKLLTVKKLGAPGSMAIGRTGNVLKWEADPLNPLGVVFMSYTIRDNEKDPMDGKIVSHDFLILKDDGEFNVDALISTPLFKSLDFTIFRGNIDEFGTNVNFDIRTTDIHLYEIKD
jgi:hypothetical protein